MATSNEAAARSSVPDSGPQPVVRVHRRQFVIGPKSFAADRDWRTIRLGPSLLLSADRDLRIERTVDADGAPWLLLGTCVEARPERANPVEELARCHSEFVQDAYEGWTGRWVLVGDGRLHPDATAMLGCYYGLDSDGAMWASSSPVLIRHAVNGATSAGEPLPDNGSSTWRPSPDARLTGRNRGISWFPPPHSGWPGIFRLLPTQILDLRTGSVDHRPLARDLGDELSDDEIVERMSRLVQNSVQRFADLVAPQKLTLLLSGGQDSRLLLSQAVSAGVSLETYTRVHRRASLADELLPPRLSHLAGYPHFAHRQRRELAGRREAILAHAGYNVSWLSAEEFLRGGSDSLDGIALAGFCAELGRDRLIGTSTSGEMIARHFCDKSPELAAAFDAWIEWRQLHEETQLDLNDFFFLEQRTAGRKGAKEQLMDLFRVERISPLNCIRLVALIAHLSSEAKVTASWIPQLIRSGDPRFADVPLNPPDSWFGMHRRILNFRGHRRRAATLRHGFLTGERTASPGSAHR